MTVSTQSSQKQNQDQGQGQGGAGTPSIRTSFGGKDERIDSARREWERATPDNFRRLQAKDLRKIIYTGSSGLGPSVLASTSSSSPRLDFSNYLTGHELTVPLLSTPRLIKRPFDPLICENMILSRATALVSLPGRTAATHVARGGSPSASQPKPVDGKSRSPSRDGGIGNGSTSDPWFDSMEENNTRLALEVSLVLILCQALEGVRSPRLAVRDRELIIRETATELSVFFDFLEHQGRQVEWPVAATLVDPEDKRTRLVPTFERFNDKLPTRLVEGSTVHKIPTALLNNDSTMETISEEPERELRSRDDIVSSGGFGISVDMKKFLPLLGKLLKSLSECLDSAQFG